MVGIFRMLSHRGGGVGDGGRQERKGGGSSKKSIFSCREALIILKQGCQISIRCMATEQNLHYLTGRHFFTSHRRSRFGKGARILHFQNENENHWLFGWWHLAPLPTTDYAGVQ